MQHNDDYAQRIIGFLDTDITLAYVKSSGNMIAYVLSQKMVIFILIRQPPECIFELPV